MPRMIPAIDGSPQRGRPASDVTSEPIAFPFVSGGFVGRYGSYGSTGWVDGWRKRRISRRVVDRSVRIRQWSRLLQ
jgi:hypothetical protein